MTKIRRNVLLVLEITLPTVFLVARLYFPLVGPRSGRELVATFSGLPMPLLVQTEEAINRCSGTLCQDYYARALIRLPKEPCSRALTAARNLGYREFPLPEDIRPPYEVGQPATPNHGFFRYAQPKPQELRFSWIDADTCRVFVEFSLE
jgi:hypothetical protein